MHEISVRVTAKGDAEPYLCRKRERLSLAKMACYSIIIIIINQRNLGIFSVLLPEPTDFEYCLFVFSDISTYFHNNKVNDTFFKFNIMQVYWCFSLTHNQKGRKLINSPQWDSLTSENRAPFNTNLSLEQTQRKDHLPAKWHFWKYHLKSL